MKKMKTTIIILIVIILLCTIIMSLVKIIQTKKSEVEDSKNESSSNAYTANVEEEDKQLSTTDCLKIKNCINRYYNYINKLNYTFDITDESGKRVMKTDFTEANVKVYSILSQNYIANNNIDQSDVFKYVENINDNIIYNVLEIEETDMIDQYKVTGILQNIKNEALAKTYFIVNINKEINCFSIEPVLEKDVDFSKIETKYEMINKNKYNEIPKTATGNEDICKEYLLAYKRLMLVAPQEAYNHLDDTYKKLKFPTVDDFKTYIADNKDEISKICLKSYQVTNNNGEKRYVCIDQNGKYYIFNEKVALEYKIVLDTYTIDLPEFTQKYNNSDTKDKIMLNLEKIREAINNKDANYVYSKLNSKFKENNFKTVEDLKQYLQNNFYTNNKFSYKTADPQEENLYLVTLDVVNLSNSNENKAMTFVIKLNDGTDFEISFSNK